MSLTTLDAVKTANKIVGTAEDGWLNQMWPACERALKTLLGYELEQQTYTEFYGGTNTDALLLRQVPVWMQGPAPQFTQLTVWQDDTGYWGQGTNNPFDPVGALLADGKDYFLELDGPNNAYSSSGILRRIGDIWKGTVVQPSGLLARRPITGRGNIKVQYVAGYNPIPSDIALAIWQGVGMLRARATYGFGGMLTSESFDGYSYSLTPMEMLLFTSIGTVQEIVANYKRLVI